VIEYFRLHNLKARCPKSEWLNAEC
jgi:hypothetical protein